MCPAVAVTGTARCAVGQRRTVGVGQRGPFGKRGTVGVRERGPFGVRAGLAAASDQPELQWLARRELIGSRATTASWRVHEAAPGNLRVASDPPN